MDVKCGTSQLKNSIINVDINFSFPFVYLGNFLAAFATGSSFLCHKSVEDWLVFTPELEDESVKKSCKMFITTIYLPLRWQWGEIKKKNT